MNIHTLSQTPFIILPQETVHWTETVTALGSLGAIVLALLGYFLSYAFQIRYIKAQAKNTARTVITEFLYVQKKRVELLQSMDLMFLHKAIDDKAFGDIYLDKDGVSAVAYITLYFPELKAPYNEFIDKIRTVMENISSKFVYDKNGDLVQVPRSLSSKQRKDLNEANELLTGMNETIIKAKI